MRLFQFRTLVVGILALSLAGCVSRPKESAEYRDVLPQEAVALDASNSSDVANIRSDDGVVDILALSSGGAYGAYGVGFLNGWTASGTRPKFDVVTGVSTGALISVFAFLGSQYDELLKQLYTDTASDEIFIEKGFTGYFSDSVYDNTPLKKQIERAVTPRILKLVAAEHAKGRRLYVATTNLDSGELVVWDMGAIATGGRSNPLQHFQKVLRASAAVPGFFAPVYIKPKRGVQLRQAHVDGGVKSPLLVRDFLFSSKNKKRKLYVVANDSIAGKDAYSAVESNLASIAQKTISTLTRELLIQNVNRGYVRAVNSGTEFYLTSVPEKIGQNATSLKFNKKFLRKLYKAGVDQFSSPKPWLRRPNAIQSFDVVRR